jgi:hypothetical protein
MIHEIYVTKSGNLAVRKVKDASGHDHKANGQFGSGGSSATKPKGKESQGAKHKRNQQARRAEGAGQSTLGGGKAIQTLLGGGSALDKIGWLNTSKKPEASRAPEKKPEAEKPKEPELPKAEPGKGSPATFEEIAGESPKNIKVEGNIDHTKPYIVRISGKNADHSKTLKLSQLGFKWGSKSKTWYKGIEPKEGEDSKAVLLDHINRAVSDSGTKYKLNATLEQGKLTPAKGTPGATSSSESKPVTAAPTTSKPFPSNPNDGKPGTVPAHELGSLLSNISEMEDEIVRHQARRDWEPEVKLSAPIPELKRKIDEARAKYKESSDRLTPAARYEILSEHQYNKIKPGRRSGPTSELRELGEKGGLYKK